MSKRVTTKSIKKIDSSKFTTKRRIVVEMKESLAWYSEYITQPIKPLKQEARAKLDENGNAVLMKKEFVVPVLSKNYVFFSTACQKPKFITDLINQMRLFFNIVNDVNGQSVYLYQPTKPEDKFNKEVFTVQTPELTILSRVVVSIGHREAFDLTTDMVEGANCTINCNSGECFEIPIGIASKIAIKFDNTTSMKTEEKKGFRSEFLKKEPTKRFVCIIDFHTTLKVMGDAMKVGAKALCSENSKAKSLISSFADGLGLDMGDTTGLDADTMQKLDSGLGEATLDPDLEDYVEVTNPFSYSGEVSNPFGYSGAVDTEKIDSQKDNKTGSKEGYIKEYGNDEASLESATDNILESTTETILETKEKSTTHLSPDMQDILNYLDDN